MRIVILDDHPLVREGLTAVISAEQDMTLVGAADSVRCALELLQRLRPDLMVLDLRLRGEDGLDVVRKAREESIPCRFLVLTSAAGREDYRRAMELQVPGYALKDALPEELLLAIRIVAKGRRYIDPSFMDAADSEKGAHGNGFSMLTFKEREVLRLLGEGMNNRQIANRLFVTEFTVKKHMGQILGKLNLPDRTQAALYANAMGIARFEAGPSLNPSAF